MDGKALNEVSGPDAPLSRSIMKPELVMKEVCIVSMDMRTRFFQLVNNSVNVIWFCVMQHSQQSGNENI